MRVWLKPVDRKKFFLQLGAVVAAVALGEVAGCAARPVSSSAEKSSGGGQTASGKDGSAAVRRTTLKAILAAKGRPTTVLSSMRVYGAPLELVETGLAAAVARREGKVQEIRHRLDELAGNIVRAQERLHAAEVTRQPEDNESVVLNDPDERRPPQRAADRASRSELDELLAKRNREDATDSQVGQQKAVDEMRQRARESAASDLRKLKDEQRAVEVELQNATKLGPFEYLSTCERSPHRSWVTDSEGTAEIIIPGRQPWVLWASTSRGLRGDGTEKYQWIALLMDTGDTNNTIYFGDSNRFDGTLPTGLMRSVSQGIPNE